MRPTQSPLSFTQNKGQVVDSEGKQRNDVLFTAQNQGVSMYFRANALSYVFPQVETRNGELAITALYRTDVEFVGANPAPEVVSEKMTPNRSTFYLGYAL